MAAIPLRLVNEPDRLMAFPDAEALLAADIAAGQCRVLAGAARRASEFPANPIGRIGGPCAPEWCTPDQQIALYDVRLFRLRGGYVLPRLGVVMSPDGGVMEHSWREAAFVLGTPAVLPGAIAAPQGAVFSPPRSVEKLGRAIVTLPWGGVTNYGHFLLDCMPAVAQCRDMPALRGHRFMFPPLTHWQKRHLELAGLADYDELPGEIYWADEILWTSCLDHFMHWPNDNLNLLAELATRLHRAAEPVAAGKLYISRQGDAKRLFPQETALEAALMRRGFAVVRPERLAIDEQIALFRGARAVVGCTGAGFANCIFCRPGARLVEVQPTQLQGIWVRNLAALRRLSWNPYFCAAAPAAAATVIGGAARPEFGITIDLDIENFLAFLDAVGV